MPLFDNDDEDWWVEADDVEPLDEADAPESYDI